jgi:hypothetical protein
MVALAEELNLNTVASRRAVGSSKGSIDYIEKPIPLDQRDGSGPYPLISPRLEHAAGGGAGAAP